MIHDTPDYSKCQIFNADCLTLRKVLCIMYHVSCIMYHVSCIMLDLGIFPFLKPDTKYQIPEQSYSSKHPFFRHPVPQLPKLPKQPNLQKHWMLRNYILSIYLVFTSKQVIPKIQKIQKQWKLQLSYIETKKKYEKISYKA